MFISHTIFDEKKQIPIKNKNPKIFCFILAVLLHGLYNFFAGSEKFWWLSIVTIIYAIVKVKFSFDKITQEFLEVPEDSNNSSDNA